MSETDKFLIGGLPDTIHAIADYITWDDDEQMELYSAEDWIFEQDPKVVRALGSYCVARAEEFIKIARHCQDALVELEEISKPRFRPIDLSKQSAVFRVGDGQ